MGNTYDWHHPLPFGDSHWVKKDDVQPLVNSFCMLLAIVNARKITPLERDTVNDAVKALERLTGSDVSSVLDIFS